MIEVTPIVQTVEIVQNDTSVTVEVLTQTVEIQSQGTVGPGVAAGGTTGQYLRKNSNAQYDAYWDTLDISTADITGVLGIDHGGTGADNASDARDNLGLGSIATQDAESVLITGGTITGITDLAIADGGTGASTAAGARANLQAAILGTNNDITSMTGLTGGISTPDFINFDLTANPALTTGRLAWNSDDGTLDIGLTGGSVLQVGQEQLFYAKNTSGGLIANGSACMFTGTVGSSGKLTFAKAVSNGTVSYEYMMGIATQDIADNGFGYVTTFGLIRGLNTTGSTKTVPESWADGDLLYFDPVYHGELTKNQPSAPAFHSPVAVVVNAGPGGSGSLFVRMKTGESLNELHDVKINGTLGNNSFIVYDSTDSRWENRTPTEARTALGLGTIATQNANNVSISGGTISGIVDLAIADGGTGASTAQDARNNLLPTQSTNAGKYLKTDGTNASWDALDISTADITGTLPIANGGTGATTATDARDNLGLEIGVDVQPYDATILKSADIGVTVQAYDAGLQSIAGLTTAADQMIYTTASDTYAVTGLTSAGRNLIDDADASAQRTTLGLGSIATQDANNVTVTGGTINGTSIGATTPSTGAFTTAQASNLRVNQAWDEGTGRLQVNGQAAIEGNVISNSILAKGGNNALLRSQEFDNTGYWSRNAVNVTANTTTAPDGTITADSLDGDGTNNQHYITTVNSSIWPAASVLRTFSIYAKKNTSDYITILVTGSVGTVATFNLETGTLESLTPGSGEQITTNILPTPNGFYRCTLTLYNPFPNGFNIRIYPTISNAAVTTSNGIYIWGSQFEPGSQASYYTPATTAAVTANNESFIGNGSLNVVNGNVISPSGRFLAIDGTASNPAYKSFNDFNTGMFFPAADTIAFAEGGAEAMRIDSSGNVGISVVPNSGWGSGNLKALQIGASTALVGRPEFSGIVADLVCNAYFDGSNWRRLNTGAATRFNNSPADGFIFSTSTSSTPASSITFDERFRITSTGTVVIGNGETAASPANALLQATGGSGTNITGATLTIQGGRGTGSAAGGPIVFSTSAAGSSGTTLNAATERMRISPAGNVGIGTTNPYSLTNWNILTIKGASTTSGGMVRLETSNNSTTARLYVDNAGLTLECDTNNNVVIRTNSTERIRINAAGGLTVADANDIAVGTTTGTKIGTATSQKIAFWNATPIVQPTTSIAEAAFVENSGGVNVNDDSTFDGYTLRQVVKALRNAGLLA